MSNRLMSDGNGGQNVVDPPLQESSGNSSGGSGSRRDLEIERRLSTIEEALKHVATKAWVLGGVVGGIGLAVVIALTFIRLFGM